MAPEPDILLLDEPTNHLDLPTIEWLEGELQSTRSALVVISHDRRFLEKVSNATVWLDRGQSRRLNRGFGHFEADVAGFLRHGAEQAVGHHLEPGAGFAQLAPQRRRLRRVHAREVGQDREGRVPELLLDFPGNRLFFGSHGLSSG